jgi:Uma2 family endonuclease
MAMQVAPELGIPEVKPAIESIRGRWERKISPRRRHALLQLRIGTIFTEWAGDRGEVGSEWRCYLLDESSSPSSLVPDVAYYSFGRMPPELGELREKPTIAPDIAIEILSPGERRRLLEEKIALYFDNGSRLVIVVDPQTRLVEMRERRGARIFKERDVASCDTYPDLRIDLGAIFARL